MTAASGDLSAEVSDLGGAVTWPPEPAALDYSALPQPAAVLVLVLGAAALVGAGLLARFLDVAVLRPPWTARDLPCENALYLLFSVAVADVLQAGCVLVRGLQLIIGHWFLSRPFCKLWSLVDAVAVTVRLLFLLAINGRLLRHGHWPRPLKIWLVSLLWLLVSVGVYVVVRAVGVRRDDTCGLNHAAHAPAAALWRYVMVDAPGLALLPVAVGVHLWYRSRPLGGAAESEADRLDEAAGRTEEVDGRGGDATSADNVVTARKDELEAEAAPLGVPKNNTEEAGAVAVPRSPLPYAHRIRKLERCDTYTPSTFTLKNFWGMPSVDEASSASGFTELGGDDSGRGEGEGEEHRHHCVSLHTVTEVRRRVHLFMLALSLAHFCFSLGSCVVHVLIDLQLTEDDGWETTAKVLDLGGQLQPLTTVLIFSKMFPKMYKMLFG